MSQMWLHEERTSSEYNARSTLRIPIHPMYICVLHVLCGQENIQFSAHHVNCPQVAHLDCYRKLMPHRSQLVSILWSRDYSILQS